MHAGLSAPQEKAIDAHRATAREFVQLGRTFHELREADDIDLNGAFRVGGPLRWSDLLTEYRVVLLAEAGAGKTEEIRNAARQLAGEGAPAFFLRLEHVPHDFEFAFEVGTLENFKKWLDGQDEGWLLLDSVDEARLKNPRDFELAIRKIGRLIDQAKDRAHVVVTGRSTAWRPKTDLECCATYLPHTPALVVARDQTQDDSADAVSTQARAASSTAGFKIVTIDDLNREQVGGFIKAFGVDDVEDFLEAVERADAWQFTARPQDLSYLAAFWRAEGRIGSRLEVLRNSVGQRLEERDQGRAEARPLAPDRVREAVRLLAGAATLVKDPTIRVPDGADNSSGIPAQAALPDWHEQDQSTLLSRPIFDEAIYGTVRFHHRSVREYLTAEWLSELLMRQSSRRAIEDLIFKTQYGIEIITPTLRPIVPWLAILDEKIRQRVSEIEPEVLLEGGDPSQLPLEVRREILNEVSQQIVRGSAGRSFQNRDAVQRFANADLVPDIRALLTTHGKDDELASFLFRMVWLGELKELLPEVLLGAEDASAEKYRRITAIRAVKAVGTEADIERIRAKFAAEAEALDRDWLSEFLDGIELSDKNIGWLIDCAGKTEARPRFSGDHLTDVVVRAVSTAETRLLPFLIAAFDALLDEPPHVEGRFCRVSQRFGWLLAPAAKAVEILVKARDARALVDAALGILRKLATARDYKDHDLVDGKVEFANLVSAWPELNRKLFWFTVRDARRLTSRGVVRSRIIGLLGALAASIGLRIPTSTGPLEKFGTKRSRWTNSSLSLLLSTSIARAGDCAHAATS